MPKFMLGNVRHQLDDKGRMRIPAKFREGVGANLYVIPEDKFESVIASLGVDNLYANNDANDMATDILGNGDYLEEDAQGRVRLSKELAKTAGIDKEIVFVGKATFLEIWPAEAWDARFSVLNPDNLNRMLDKLKKYGV